MYNDRLSWSDRPFRDSEELPPDEPTIEAPLRKRHTPIFKIVGIICLAAVLASVLMVLVLRWIAVPTTAFMLQYDDGKKKLHYHWVPWERISPAMPIAVVAAEDQNFPKHWGFDFDAIADALDENKNRSRPRGASTITQQVAKNLFLWPGRSWLRKGMEAYFTILIELFWPKQRILEVYLNIAEFGPGVFGVGAASRIYYGVTPARLDREKAAILAAVLPSPGRMSAARPSTYVRQRAAQIRRQVEVLGGSRYLSHI